MIDLDARYVRGGRSTLRLNSDPVGFVQSPVEQLHPAEPEAKAIAGAIASEAAAHGMSGADILAEVAAFLSSWAHHPSHTCIDLPPRLHLVLDAERAEYLGTAQV
jgi:hypothetical protein